jgi:hypothetical protein
MRRWYWAFDVLVVLLFVVIGREDHGFVSDFSDYVRVASPFLIGLGLTILAIRAWRRPMDWRTGMALALGTLLLGMLVRRFVFDSGTARAFIIVSAAFFVAGMVGWRLLAAGVLKLLTVRRAAAT